MKKIFLTIFMATLLALPVYSIKAAVDVPCTAPNVPPGCTTTTQKDTSGSTPAPAGSGNTCSYDKNSTQLCNPIAGANDLNSLIIKGLKFLLGLIGTVAVLMIVIAGFKMVSSQGDEHQVKSAKQTITWAIAGMVVAILAYSIVAIVQNVLINAN